jgi:hypothetical protein
MKKTKNMRKEFKEQASFARKSAGCLLNDKYKK